MNCCHNYVEYCRCCSCIHGTCLYVIYVQIEAIHAMTKMTAIIGRNQQISHQFSMSLWCIDGYKTVNYESLDFVDWNEITLAIVCWGSCNKWQFELLGFSIP